MAVIDELEFETDLEYDLAESLIILLLWATGDASKRTGNPFSKKEIKQGLEIIGELRGVDKFDALD